LRLNKKVLIAILMLSVFTVGTMTFADTVEAAKAKKFDSGSFKFKGQTVKYYAFIKGNSILVDYYMKNQYLGGYDIVKGKNKVTIKAVNSKGKYSSKDTVKTNKSLKTFYYSFNKSVIKKMKSSWNKLIIIKLKTS